MDTNVKSFFDHTDPILARLIEQYSGSVRMPVRKSLDTVISELCEAIVSQQLSVQAAATIWSRAKLVVDNWNEPSSILRTRDEPLRKAGLSRQKISYVKNIATAVLDKTIQPARYNQFTEVEIIDELVKIKGVGVWTAEMFLIFTLGRSDVFSFGDLGLRNAITRHYGSLSKQEIINLSISWSPYRSYASLVLWRSLDNEPKKS